MTILFLSPYFYPHIGGVEKHILGIAKILRKRGYKVIVITEGEKDRRFKISGIDVHQVYFGKKGWFKKFKIWLELLKYKKYIKTSDIIHCHDVFFWYIPFRFIYPKKKVFITFHGFENIPPTKKEIFIRKLSEKLVNGNMVVGAYIEKWFGTKADEIVYGAIDEIKLSKVLGKIAKPKILILGRLDSDIGIKTYIKSLRLIKNFSLEVCGDGEFADELRKLGKVNGFVKSLDKYLGKTDYVFASSYLSIIEAISFGKIVFSVYDNPLKRDYLMQSPMSKFTIIEGSAKNLANKVKLINKDTRLREELKKEGYSWVKEQTWSNLTKRYLSLWKQHS